MGLIRSGYTKLTPEDDDELTDYVWPIIREMIKTAIENNQNLMIEGCYIPFDWRKDFEKKYASIIEKRFDDTCCTMESVLEDNAQFLALAKKHEENIVFIDDAYEINIDLL